MDLCVRSLSIAPRPHNRRHATDANDTDLNMWEYILDTKPTRKSVYFKTFFFFFLMRTRKNSVQVAQIVSGQRSDCFFISKTEPPHISRIFPFFTDDPQGQNGVQL